MVMRDRHWAFNNILSSLTLTRTKTDEIIAPTMHAKSSSIFVPKVSIGALINFELRLIALIECSSN
jgi:hypothetical protein